MPTPTVPDFSSPEYWSKRFENETSFEWLIPSAKVIPLILKHAEDVIHQLRDEFITDDTLTPYPNSRLSIESHGNEFTFNGSRSKRRKLNILHFGAGTSSLGRDVELALNEWVKEREWYCGGSMKSSGITRDQDDKGEKRSKVDLAPNISDAESTWEPSSEEAARASGLTNGDDSKVQKSIKDNRDMVGDNHPIEISVHDADYVADSIRTVHDATFESNTTSTLISKSNDSASISDCPQIPGPHSTRTPPNGSITCFSDTSNVFPQSSSQHIPPTSNTRPMLNLDVLSLSSVTKSTPEPGWDMYLDKSTADAISCGPPIILTTESKHILNKTRPKEDPSSNPISPTREFDYVKPLEETTIEPLHLLLLNLYSTSSIRTKWISISYSSTRFQFNTEFYGWKVIERVFLASTSLPEGRVVREKIGKNEWTERTVWEPQVGVWGWVLERI